MAKAYVEKMAGNAGFDWLLIDAEHAPNDIRGVGAQLAWLTCIHAAGVLAIEPAFPANCRAAGANFSDIGVDVLVYVKAMHALVGLYCAQS